MAVCLAATTCAWAADFRDVQLRSNLGQPFSAQLTVTGAGQNGIDASCYKAKVEALDGTLLTVPRVTSVKSLAGSQTAELLFSSKEAINEPAVKFKIEMVCDGYRLRDYALLLDYAEISTPLPSPVADITQDNTRSDVAVAEERPRELPKPARVRTKTLKMAVPGATEKNEAQPKRVAAVPRFSMDLTPPRDTLHVSNQDSATTLTKSSAGNPKEGSLEQQRLAENKAAQEAFARMLRDEPAPASALNTDALNNEIKKVQGLENEVAHLKLDLQVKAEKAQSVSSWLIAFNVAVLLILLIVIGIMAYMLKKARSGEKAGWWHATDEPAGFQIDQVLQPAVSGEIAPEPETAERPGNVIPEAQPRKSIEAVQEQAIAEYLSSLLPDEPGAIDFLDTDTLEQPAVVPDVPVTADPVGKKTADKFNLFANRELQSIHIEEVSDAMQEAEFWMSINDPARAIEILEPHCVDDHPETPVMWLCLLELYRLVNDEQQYEALRQRFRAQFNTNILPFNEKPDPGTAKHLEDFDHLMAKCCTFWHTSYMLPFLESLLVNDRNEERVGFDLSVYQDILLLIGICKQLDRSEEAAA